MYEPGNRDAESSDKPSDYENSEINGNTESFNDQTFSICYK